jgi:hypothetical protein
MSTATTSPNQRVAYRNGILLYASDFQQEQQYHRSRLALVLSQTFGFGTIAGLKVEWFAAGTLRPEDNLPRPEDELIVQPGLALDRAGRLIEVTPKQFLRLNRWFAFEAAQPGAALKVFDDGGDHFFVADLFLGFSEWPQGLRPGFPEPASDATDAIVPSRTNDGFALQLVARNCDPDTQLPKVPAKRFPTTPTTKAAMLAAVYAAYEPQGPASNQEYPQGFGDTTAVFLARIRIPIEPPPADDSPLQRLAAEDVIVDDADRPIVAPGDLLFRLLPL